LQLSGLKSFNFVYAVLFFGGIQLMFDILLELGVEELPISEAETIIDEFGDSVKDFFRENEIEFKKIISTGSPRRIVLIIEQLIETQPDKEKKYYGPPKNLFFNEDGSVSKAGESFLNKSGKKADEISFEKKDELKPVDFAFYNEKIKGCNSLDIFRSNLKPILDNLNIKKRMKWSDKNFIFSRPVRWICALCNDKILELELGGINSSNKTYGHRFLSSGQIEINSIEEYFVKLENNYVIADKSKRKKILIEKIKNIINPDEDKIDLDEELVNINNFLVEYPTPFKCEFPANFLNLPEPALISTMKKHQKYFPVYSSKTGKLSNFFIGVSNMTEKHIDNIKSGNTRVITARFEDAKFYYYDDLKKDISFFNDKLKSITYIDGIGTIYEKTGRIKNLIKHLSVEINIDAETLEDCLKAGEICKFDLASGMVYEFPQLQGIIGMHYAFKKNIKEEIARTVEEHYLPSGNLKELPKTKPAILTALADKFDSIASCFCLGIKPTGSADPYALRRAARGIIALIRTSGFNIDVYKVFEKSLELCLDDYKKKSLPDKKKVLSEIIIFFESRMENILLENGFEQNFINMSINAAGSKPSLNINSIFKKTEAASKMKGNDDLEKVGAAFKRINNILKNITEFKKVDKNLFTANIETILYEKFLNIKSETDKYTRSDDFESAIKKLSELGAPIDEYFNEVMVMDKNENIKINRVSMLNEIIVYYKNIYAF